MGWKRGGEGRRREGEGVEEEGRRRGERRAENGRRRGDLCPFPVLPLHFAGLLSKKENLFRPLEL